MAAPSFASQLSFAGGEFSPSMAARVDIAKYLSGLKTARNVNILPHGGVRNRPGTKYVATAGNSSGAVRLISFVASTTVAYIIELGAFYARFYTNDGQVLAANVPAWVTSTVYAVGNFVTNGGITYYCLVAHTSGTFATDLAAGKWVAQTAYQIVTPWAAADLAALKFTQSADVMYFAHGTYAPRQLTFTNSSSWALALFPFFGGPFMLENATLGRTLTPSATSNSTTAKTISSVVSISGGYGVGTPPPPFVGIKTSTAHGLNTGDTVSIDSLDGALATQLNGNSYTASVTSTTQITLCFLGTSTPIRYTGGSSFTTYTPGTGNLNVPSGVPTLTANFTIFDTGHVGAFFNLRTIIPATTLADAGFTANTHVSSSIKCGQTYSIVTSGVWGGRIKIQISNDIGVTWTTIQTLQSSGAENFQLSGETGQQQCLLRVIGDTTVTWSGTLTIDLTAQSFFWNGIVQIITYTSNVVAVMTIVNPEGLADTAATALWSEGSWSNFRGWPTCVAFFQDRECFASTTTEPATVWASQVGDYPNFGVSSPIIASDSFSLIIPSRQLNAISSLVVMPQFMVALASDSEWGIGAGPDGTFSPTSISIQLQGHRGSSSIDPAVIGAEIILMQQMGSVVRNLIFQLATSSFFGDNISIISQHLFTGYQISAIAYQQEPDSIVWMVRNDGKLLSLTYMREQEMAAWTWHDTSGLFESVAVIPNPTLGINEIWFVVSRTVGGVTQRYIEHLMPRDQGTATEDQFFVDCGLTYDSTPATVITGLTHLIGRSVSILADGNVVPAQIVDANGAITLGIAASVVQAGLPYISDVETLKIEAADQRGTLQGRRVAIPEVTVRFWNSRGGYLGPVAPAGNGTDGLDPILQRNSDDLLETAIPLQTADFKQSMDGGYDYGAHMFFRQTDPLPFTILAFLPSLVASEK